MVKSNNDINRFRKFRSIATLLVTLVAPFWIVLVTFFYAAFANGFFLVSTDLCTGVYVVDTNS